jgi:hypothetical protein
MHAKPEKRTELELDECFWRAITTNQTFQRWFLQKTKFASFDLDLIKDENWHHAWYKEPTTGIESETDILLIFRDRACGSRGHLDLPSLRGGVVS